MIPLLIFLLALIGVYLGAIEAAFSALMRLSLRLLAERSGRPDAIGTYLDDPILLFVPVRLLLTLATVSATALLAAAIGISGAHRPCCSVWAWSGCTGSGMNRAGCSGATSSRAFRSGSGSSAGR